MKKIICFILILSLVLCFLNLSAFADPVLTISQLASVAFGYGQFAGINWTFTNGTVNGAKTWMENKINNWIGDRSITEVFGSELLKVEAGKLIIPATIATALGAFLNDLMFDLGADVDNPVIANEGFLEGIPLSSEMRSFVTTSGPGLEMFRYSMNNFPIFPVIGSYSGNYGYSMLNLNGTTLHMFSNGGSWYSFHYWQLREINGSVYCYYVYSTSQSEGGERVMGQESYKITQTLNLTDKLEVSLGENYGYPEYPDVGYQWEGTITGAEPDTNLDQMLELIDTDIPDNNLIIEGEVVNPIDPPVPPTPIPVDPDTPLQDVPWDGLNDLIGQTGEGIVDSINTQTGTLEDIDTKTGEISETLEDTNQAVQTISETLQPTEILERTFDLRRLFPFCIPFDVYNLLSKFDAAPLAPHVYLPFTIQSIGFTYTFDLDFSAFDGVAAALRAVELIVYCIGLAWATSKVIKW